MVELVDILTGPPETKTFKHLYLITQLYECDLERIITSSQRLTDSHAQYFVYQVSVRACHYCCNTRWRGVR